MDPALIRQCRCVTCSFTSNIFRVVRLRLFAGKKIMDSFWNKINTRSCQKNKSESAFHWKIIDNDYVLYMYEAIFVLVSHYNPVLPDFEITNSLFNYRYTLTTLCAPFMSTSNSLWPNATQVHLIPVIRSQIAWLQDKHENLFTRRKAYETWSNTQLCGRDRKIR
jgi:hypothetical protein